MTPRPEDIARVRPHPDAPPRKLSPTELPPIEQQQAQHVLEGNITGQLQHTGVQPHLRGSKRTTH